MTDPFAAAEPTLPPYASWGRRFAALLIDGLLLAVPFIIPLIVAVVVTADEPASTSEDDDDGVLIAVVIGWLLTILLPFAYYTVLHGRPRGQTLGKRALGIRVIGEDFQPIGYGRAFGRFLMGWVMWLACYVPGILDGLWPLWDDKNQALHDKVANSIVVRVLPSA